MNKRDLKEKLVEHDIPLDKWGKGEAKELTDLYREIRDGETMLTVEDGILIRSVSVLGLNVFYSKDHNSWRLKETEQVFSDGRQRVRDYLKCSVSEKIIGNEPINVDLIFRALNEELFESKSPPNPVASFGWGGVEKRVEVSPSYPNLRSVYTMYRADVWLSDTTYNPAGYAEVQGNITTFFRWFKETD